MKMRFLPIFLLCLTGCCSQHTPDKKEQILYSNKTDLSTNLKKAHDITLNTGQPVTIRMTPAADQEQIQNDQNFAIETIGSNFGKDSILSVERPKIN